MDDVENLLAGVGLMAVAVDHWFWRRRVEATKTTPIALMKSGVAEAQGYIWGTNPELRNSKGQHCAYLKWSVEFTRKNFFRKKEDHERFWRSTYTDIPSSQMIIIDHTAAARLNPKRAKLKYETLTYRWEPDVVNNPHLKELVERATAKLGAIGSADRINDYRLVESYIRQGSPGYALGFFSGDQQTPSALGEAAQSFFERLVPAHLNRPIEVAQKSPPNSEPERQKMSFRLYHVTLAESVFKGDLTMPIERLDHLRVVGEFRSHWRHRLLIYNEHERKLLNWLYLEIAGFATGFSLAFGELFQYRGEIWLTIRTLF